MLKSAEINRNSVNLDPKHKKYTFWRWVRPNLDTFDIFLAAGRRPPACHGIAMAWPCHGIAMAMPWPDHGMTMAWPWYRHGIAMALPWHGHGMAMPWPWQGRGMA